MTSNQHNGERKTDGVIKKKVLQGHKHFKHSLQKKHKVILNGKRNYLGHHRTAMPAETLCTSLPLSILHAVHGYQQGLGEFRVKPGLFSLGLNMKDVSLMLMLRRRTVNILGEGETQQAP